MLIALTHRPSPSLSECVLTFVEREKIDYARARRQHRQYCDTLRACGARVIVLSANDEFPDGVFVEDAAVVLDEIAVLTSTGNQSRRKELQNLEPQIARYRPLRRIQPPATIEGGDVLRVAKTLYVGLSTRTNSLGLQSLRAFAGPYGYRVVPVAVQGCLHLKTACTALDDETILMNPAWVDASGFEDFRVLSVPPDEPWGANVLRIGNNLLMHSGFPRSLDMVRGMNFNLTAVDISEFSKAEAGLTCMSLIFDHTDAA